MKKQGLRGKVICSKSPAGVVVELKQRSSSLVFFSLQHCQLYNIFVLAILSREDITIDPRILFHWAVNFIVFLIPCPTKLEGHHQEIGPGVGEETYFPPGIADFYYSQGLVTKRITILGNL